MCRVDIETNKYLDANDKQDIALECFLREDTITELEKMIVQARELAKDYQGYDFTEDLEDLL